MTESSVNKIPLIGEVLSAGAAFEIDRPADGDVEFLYDGGWSLQLKSGSSVIVVRGCDLRDFRPLFAAVPAAAARGLDLLCVTGGPAYSLSKAAEEGIYFWPQGEGMQIHWYGTLPINITMTAKLTVGGAAWEEARVLNHHPSFAHFRQSQTETDLGDSYRHAYLALESLLDSISPQAPGQPERVWLLEALTEANRRAPVTADSPEEAAAKQCQEWYETERNNLFHAKSSRSARSLALASGEFKVLLRKKNWMLSFYFTLLNAHLGAANISGGGLTHHGLETVLERYDNGDFRAHAEDDSDPPAESDSAAFLREAYGQPNGEGWYLCRSLPVPNSRRVKKWWATLDNENAIWCDFAGVLEIDARDRLSAGLQIENRATSFKNRFLT